MSLNNARINISTLLENEWTETKVVDEMSDAGNKLLEQASPWIYSYIKWGAQTQKARAGDSVYESTSGIVNIRLYVRIKDGSAVREQLTDKLFDLFRFKQILGVVIKSKAVVNSGKDGGWQIRHIAISFRLRSFHSPE